MKLLPDENLSPRLVNRLKLLLPIKECEFPLRAIEDLLRRSAIRISEFQKDPDRGLLVLRFSGGRLPG